MEIVFHHLAAEEARAAEAWYSVRSVQAAERFRDSVMNAAVAIRADTGTHEIAGTKFCYIRVKSFPYRLIYVLEAPGRVRILAVAHHRRRPAYWKDRR
ncbi:MAG: type II toxin-antitoxin system RelE/ParE family toxin [Pirellulales bacterium]|nr:type II toxin-antitoxin system RelE/ParE family toxin [Pirellulales bacterium]